MFAIFLTDAMDPFYQNVSSFPTLIFTFALLLCVFYWLLAVLGVVDLDFLDLDLPETNMEAAEAGTSVGFLGGLMLRLRLTGVPFPIVFTLLSLFGWFICYYVVHFTINGISNSLLRFLIGIPIFLGSMYLSALISGAIIKPLRPIFRSANQEVEKNIIGQIAVVRTARVDSEFGEAVVEDGGAGLIVKVRPFKNEVFARGDRVALLKYEKETHVYRVISEKEFNS